MSPAEIKHQSAKTPSLGGATGWRGEVLTVVAIICLAILWGIYTLGRVPLDIHQTAWLRGDFAQVYNAWSLFTQDAGATWLFSDRASYPLPMSFSLFDPMPLLLLLGQPVSGMAGGGQYFGYYFLACVVLQGVFGYLAVRQAVILTDSEIRAAQLRYMSVLGALIWLMMPIVTHRFLGHTALSSKWVLTLGIWALLATVYVRTPRWLLINGGVLFLVSGFNPYLLLMVGGSGLVFVTLDALARRAWLDSLLRITVYIIVAATGLWLFGFLSGAVAVGGYGYYSMNALGPIDANELARLLPIDVPDATGGQSFEGFNYLGLGVICLVAIAMSLLLVRSHDGSRFPYVQALLAALAFYLLALSTTLTVGDTKLELPIPEIANDIVSRFRASGRLFWMASFWLIVASVSVCVWKLGPRRASHVLTALVMVQLIDVEPFAANIRQSLAGSQRLDQLTQPLDPGRSGVESVPVSFR